MARGDKVPFFLVKDFRKQLGLVFDNVSVKDVVESLVPTSALGYGGVLEPSSSSGEVPQASKKARLDLPEIEDDDEVPGVTHRVQHWVINRSSGTEARPSSGTSQVGPPSEPPFLRVDERDGWKSSVQGRQKQAQLLQTFKKDAALPLSRFNPDGGSKSVFLPLLNSDKHVDPSVLEGWKRLAREVDSKAGDVLRGTKQLPPDFVRWSDIIENKGGASGELPKDFVAEGFGWQRPEAFVKSGLCVTLEHHEHLGSTSINIFPHQRVPDPLAGPGSTPPSGKNLWRGWLLEEIFVRLVAHNVVDPEDFPQGFDRKAYHDFYLDNFAGRDLELSKYLIETLEVPTYYVIQEEGDLVMTTHHGSHDVVYAGGPSYQVSWNFGFSKQAGKGLLKSFRYEEDSASDGNDASNTPRVLRNFLAFCWPGRKAFQNLQPFYSKMVTQVLSFKIYI